MLIDMKASRSAKHKMDEVIGTYGGPVVVPRKAFFITGAVQGQVRVGFVDQGVVGLFIFFHKKSIT